MLIMYSNSLGALVGEWNLILSVSLFFYGILQLLFYVQRKTFEKLYWIIVLAVYSKKIFSYFFFNFLAISYIRLADIRIKLRVLFFQKQLLRLVDEIQRPYCIPNQKEASRVVLENRRCEDS